MNNDSITANEEHSPARILFLPPRGPAPIKLLSSAILRGCNVHHGSTVIRQQVELGGLAGMNSDQAGPDFAPRFLERFFEMRRMVPDSTMPEDFVERLRSPGGAPFAQVLLEAILAVDTAMAFSRHNFDPLGFSAIVPTRSPSRVRLVWECKAPHISRRAAKVGLAGCIELLPEELQPRGGSESFAAAFAALEERARRGELTTTTAVLALAAKKRGLPCETMRGPYLRLGQGASQRLMYASMTDNTSLAASQLARNKHRTNVLLAQLHLPVARQIKVFTTEEALAAAETLGYPVVIKPLKEKQATGVTVGIASAEAVATAFAHAKHANQRTDQHVIVEDFVRGHAHRLLVVGRRFVAALRTIPPTVTGDGLRTIAELVDELNRDPMRDGVRLFKVPLDDNLERDLALTGYRLSDVLGKEETVAVRSAANVAIGGLHTDVTDSVHRDNQEMAIRASEAIGLDVAGIDFVTEDVGCSYKDVGGAIIEVNARPGLCMHTWPRFGKSRPVAAAVLDLVFPAGAGGRIPTAVIAGSRGTERLARELDAILRASGRNVGLATPSKSFVNGQMADPAAAHERNPMLGLLRDKRVQTLVSCMSPRQIVKRGLGLDVCDVSAITDPEAGRSAGSVLLQAAHVLTKATQGMLVISARSKLAHEALSTIEAKRLILVGSKSRDADIKAHAAAGGAILVKVRKPQQDHDRIVLRREGKVLVSIKVARQGAGSRRSARRRMERRMFAVALAFAMGLSGNDLKAALRSKR